MDETTISKPLATITCSFSLNPPSRAAKSSKIKKNVLVSECLWLLFCPKTCWSNWSLHQGVPPLHWLHWLNFPSGSKANSALAPSQPPRPPQCRGFGTQSLETTKLGKELLELTCKHGQIHGQTMSNMEKVVMKRPLLRYLKSRKSLVDPWKTADFLSLVAAWQTYRRILLKEVFRPTTLRPSNDFRCFSLPEKNETLFL